MKKIRVRFAPSPTGPLHLGSIRTAMYNYLLAKKYHGDFILRIEDTDQERCISGTEEYILNALTWCGFIPDESPYHGGKYAPYRQSERQHIYPFYFQYLINKGYAYYAFDTIERLSEKKILFEKQGNIFTYNYQTRLDMDNSLSLTDQEVHERIEKGDKYVIRFKIPDKDQVINIHDEVRGKIKINMSSLDDKVLVKSDGMPTYHFAHVVDDHLMKITHVIRGEEWLPSLPLHILLYQAMEWDVPFFAHLPLILKPDGKGKLSKRDGETFGFPIFPLAWQDHETQLIHSGYREEGYFPEAVINMLALLGWNPGGKQEIFSIKELIDLFSLKRVGKSGAQFSKKKSQWFNQQYLKKKPLLEITKLFTQELVQHKINSPQEYVQKVVEVVRHRAYSIKDIWKKSAYFFVHPIGYDPQVLKKIWEKESPFFMKNLASFMLNYKNFTHYDVIKDCIEEFIMINNLSIIQLVPALRLALVGNLQGPDLVFIIEMIGKKATVHRIENLIQFEDRKYMD